LQFALLDELHSRDRGHGFGHRGEAKDRVGRHRCALGETAGAECALINNTFVVRRDGNDTRHLFGLDRPAQQCIDLAGLWSLRKRALRKSTERCRRADCRCRFHKFATGLPPDGHRVSSEMLH
jgi:hypothetical protein